jgi:ribosome biogenesis protein ENP2
MHGYFVDHQLYNQARLVADPYIWEKERQKRVQEKVEKERASRIRGTKKVKVNQKLADRLLQRQEKKEKVDVAAAALQDPRFKQLFEDERFFVDETSAEYFAQNPSSRLDGRHKSSLQISQERDSSEESDGDSSENDGVDDTPIRKAGDDVVMQASTSTDKQAQRSKDAVFGSRVEKPRRSNKSHQGVAVGDKELTFVPERKKSQKAVSTEEPRSFDPSSKRSASGNTFRRMGKS